MVWAVDQEVRGNPLDDSYLRCDESSVHVRLLEAESGDPEARQISSRWRGAMERRVPWKLVHAHIETPSGLPKAKEPDPEAIKSMILARPSIAGLGRDDLNNKILVDIPRSRAEDLLPSLDAVKNAIKEVLGDEMGQDTSW